MFPRSVGSSQRAELPDNGNQEAGAERSRRLTSGDIKSRNQESRITAHHASNESRHFYKLAVEEQDPDKKKGLLEQARQKNEQAVEALKSLPPSQSDIRKSLTDAVENSTRIHELLRQSMFPRLNPLQACSLAIVDKVCVRLARDGAGRSFNDAEIGQLKENVQALEEVAVVDRKLSDLYKTLLDEQPYALQLTAREKDEYRQARSQVVSHLTLVTQFATHLKMEMTLQQGLRQLPIAGLTEKTMLAALSAQHYESSFYLLLGALDEIVNPRKADRAPAGEQKVDILSDMVGQFGEMAQESEWVAHVLKGSVGDEAVVSDMMTLASCAREMQACAANSLSYVEKIEGKNDSEDSKNDFLPPALVAQAPRKRPGKKASVADTRKAPQGAQARKDAAAALITTEFDGKLLGERKGDLVEVRNYKGETISYRQQGDVWVRHVPDEGPDYVREAEEEFKASATPEHALHALNARKAKVESRVDTLLEDGARYLRLIEFMQRNDASFKHENYTFNMALEKYASAVNRLSRIADACDHLGSQHEEIKSECLKEAHSVRQRAQQLNAQMQGLKAQQIAAVKSQMLDGRKMDGERLSYLLNAGEVREVQETITRKKLAGPALKGKKSVPADFMDEHKIFLKGDTRPLILHTHYRKRNASLEEKQASHLKHASPDGTWENGPEIALSVLRSLHRTP